MPREDLERILRVLATQASDDPSLRESIRAVAAWLERIADGTAGRPDLPVDDAISDPLAWIAEFRSVVVPRARLKAEACRWVTERRTLDTQADAVRTPAHSRERDLITAAKALPDCFLWMLRGVPEHIDIETLAGSYECLASAIEVVLLTLEHLPEVGKSDLQAALSLLAESVSAARFKILQVKERSDPDVDTAFTCIRRITQIHHIYIDRHMRLNDPADPVEWESRRDRIENTRRRLHERILYVRERPCLLTTIGTLGHNLMNADSAADREQQMESLAATLEQLKVLGFAPEDPDLLSILAPAGEALRRCENPPEPLIPVRDALEAFLAERPERMRPWSRLQHRVESLLDGRWGILLTGTPCATLQASLESSLRLRKLHWIDAGSASVVPSLSKLIQSPNTAVILMAQDANDVVSSAVKTMLERRDTPVLIRIDPQAPDLDAIARTLVRLATPRLMEPVPTPEIEVRPVSTTLRPGPDDTEPIASNASESEPDSDSPSH